MKKYLVFRDGTKMEIIDENGKYWVGKSAQFRKANKSIAGVEVSEEKETEKEHLQEKPDAEIEKSKKENRKKEKKGE